MFAPLQTTNSPDIDSLGFGRVQTPIQQRVEQAKEGCSAFLKHPVSLKILLHILLLATAMVQLLVDNNESEYLRSARRTWYKFFFPLDYEASEDGSPAKIHYLYTMEEVDVALRHALKGYETIVGQSLDTLSYYPPGEEVPSESSDNPFDRFQKEQNSPFFEGRPQIAPQASLTVKKYVSPFVFDPDKDFDATTETHTFTVNSTNLGMLEDASTRLFLLRRVVDMVLSFRLITIELVSLRRACLIWDIRLVFSFKSRGQMSLNLQETIVQDCDDSTSSDDLFDLEDLLWLNIVLIFLSFSYLLAIIRMIIRRTSPTQEEALYADTEGELGLEPPTRGIRIRLWCVPCLRKAKHFLDFWVLLDIICPICIIWSSIMNLLWNSARRPTTPFHTSIVGLGNGILWTSLVQYFSHNKTYFALILTLERSVPKVAKFLLGIAPIFMGYSLFGVAYFGAKTVRFAGVTNSFVTLFSLLNGDAISETFHDLIPLGAFVAELYLYSFILLWTYVVLNILIAIVEESFFTSLWSSSQEKDSPRASQKWFRTNRIPTYHSGEADVNPTNGPLDTSSAGNNTGFSPLLNEELRQDSMSSL